MPPKVGTLGFFEQRQVMFDLPIEQEKMALKLSKGVCNLLCKNTVLMCDDVSYNLVPLEWMLRETFKITSTQLSSGEEAVNCFKERMYATCCQRMYKLVLTDI